jgi:hypothetical protein
VIRPQRKKERGKPTVYRVYFYGLGGFKYVFSGDLFERVGLSRISFELGNSGWMG